MKPFIIQLFGQGSNPILRFFDAPTMPHPIPAERPLSSGVIDAFIREIEAEYDTRAPNLADLGARLYQFLDDPGSRWLEQIVGAGSVALYVDVDERLRHIPWELLRRGNDFLCGNPRLFTPVRRIVNPVTGPGPLFTQSPPPANRPLRVLFMASSPENVFPVLDFEKEERFILEATQRHPVALTVEESGSLEGLKDRIDAHEQGYFDVFLLSGHADIIGDEPCFLLEDATGKGKLATTRDLANAFSGRWPRLVFLSGCKTAEAAGVGALPSMCEALVRAGAPAVIGWALPVGDSAASLAEKELCERLATARDIDEAVAYARQQLLENGIPDWHLLRIYADNTPLSAVVTPERTPKRERILIRPAHAEFLDAGALVGGNVEVCPRELFVGRRRLLQRCLRVLRSREGDTIYSEGVLLHGIGGIGKSSVAARLCERIPEHRRLIRQGAVDEIALIKIICERYPLAAETLNQNIPLKARLQQLLEGQFAQDPAFFIFDDFEANFDKSNVSAGPNAEASRVLSALLAAIRESASESKVIVTSRYAFNLPGPARLHPEMVESMVGAELAKKLSRLANLRPSNTSVDSRVRTRAIELAAGNPRLLERLDKLLSDPATDLLPILAAMAATTEKYLEETFLDGLLAQQSPECRRMLALLAVLELPVDRAALDATVADEIEPHLVRSISSGLLEINKDATTGEDYYSVPGLLKPMLNAVVTEAERLDAARRALQWLYVAWKKHGSEQRALELHRLALLVGDKEIAAVMVVVLARNWCRISRFKETTDLCQRTLELARDFRVLRWLAAAEEVIGHPGRAMQHLEEALALCPRDDTDGLSSSAANRVDLMTGIASLYARAGNTDGALAVLEQAMNLAESADAPEAKSHVIEVVAGIRLQRGEVEVAQALLRNLSERKLVIRDASILNTIALQIAEQGNFDGASELMHNAIRYAQSQGNDRTRAILLNNYAAIIMRFQENVAVALPLWQEALSLSETVGDVRGMVAPLRHLAAIARQNGEIDAAYHHLLKAARALVAVHDAPGLIQLLGSLASLREAESIYYAAQAMWLCLRIGAGSEAMTPVASALVKLLGVENELSSRIAAAAVLGIQELEKDSLPQKKHESAPFHMLIACARANNVVEGPDFTNWVKNILGNSQPEFCVRLMNDLRKLVPHDKWIFPSGVAMVMPQQ